MNPFTVVYLINVDFQAEGFQDNKNMLTIDTLYFH